MKTKQKKEMTKRKKIESLLEKNRVRIQQNNNNNNNAIVIVIIIIIICNW